MDVFVCGTVKEVREGPAGQTLSECQDQEWDFFGIELIPLQGRKLFPHPTTGYWVHKCER